MFLSHFGLTTQPFQITPDPAFLYRSIDNRGAENVIQFSISQLAPLTVVTGEVGIGKTCLIRKFLNEAPDDLTIGLISNYTGGNDDLYTWVLNAFGLPTGATGIDAHRAIERFLLAEFQAGRRSVLMIDEAQALRNNDLEQLRMLSNINDGRDALLMLFLVGQPELRARMQQPENRQFAQRIVTMAHLEPMSARDTALYVRHRLRVAGASYDIFDDAALQMVHQIAYGIPRVINVVCNLVMFEAFGDNTKRINGDAMARYLNEAEQNGYLAHLADIRVKATTGAAVVNAPSAAASGGTAPAHSRAASKAPSLRLVATRKPIPKRNIPSSRAPAAQIPPAQPPKADIKPVESEPPQAEPQGIPITEVALASSDTVKENPDTLVLKDPLPKAPAAKDRLPPIEPFVAQTSLNPPVEAPSVEPSRRWSGWGALAACVAIGGAYLAVTQMPERAVEVTSLPQSASEAVADPDSGIASKTAAIPLSFVPETISPLPDPGGSALIASALELGATDPKAAAVAYARAALRGEKRAAYFLAQMYETGDGVPYDPLLARAWYTHFPDPNRSVTRRLEQLNTRPITSKLSAPVPVLGGPIQDSAAAEFVWTGLSGSEKVRYIVELATDSAAVPIAVAETTVSAAMIDDLSKHATAKLWRVVAINGETGAQAPSDWQPMGASGN